MRDALHAGLSSLSADRFALDGLKVEDSEHLGSTLHEQLHTEARAVELNRALDRLLIHSPVRVIRFFPGQTDESNERREHETRKLARRCVGYFWTQDEASDLEPEAFVQPVPDQLIFLDGESPVSNQLLTAIHEMVHAYCHNNEGIGPADVLFAEAHAVRITGLVISEVGELLFMQFVDELIKTIRGCMNGLYHVAQDEERRQRARTLMGHAAVFEHDDFCATVQLPSLMKLSGESEREWYLSLLPELLDQGLFAVLSRIRSEAKKNGNLKAFEPYRPILHETIDRYRSSDSSLCGLEQALQNSF